MNKRRSYTKWTIVKVLLLVVLACVLLGACAFPQALGPNEPPTVTINEPASGASVVANSYLYISASASGSSPITRVELWVDGELAGTQESGAPGGVSPFDVSFELLVPPGEHTLFVRALNAAGLMENSAPVSISAAQVSSSPGTTSTPERAATAAVGEASPTPEPTSPPQPTATSVPTTPAPPTATPATGPVVVFRDDFNGALESGWSWVREDPSHWNLTEASGSLRIILQPDGVSTGAKNLLLRAAPAGKFEIATSVRFTPTTNYQFAGLLIYQDDSSYIQFGRAFCSGGVPSACVGNGVYIDNIQAGQCVTPNHATATGSQSQAYLRLRRDGSTYTTYYSEDGASWSLIGQDTNSLTPSRVGLVAAQAYQAETTADFDYFTITTVP